MTVLCDVIRDGISFFSPRRYVFVAQLTPRWKGLITIFQYNTWAMIVFIILLSAMAWFAFGLSMPEKQPHKNMSLCMLNSWSVFLGISANNRPDWDPLRIFFILLALYAVNVTTIYTSKLINVFTDPKYDDQIQTMDQAIEANLPFGMAARRLEVT